jgi:hypothetical protein
MSRGATTLPMAVAKLWLGPQQSKRFA